MSAQFWLAPCCPPAATSAGNRSTSAKHLAAVASPIESVITRFAWMKPGESGKRPIGEHPSREVSNVESRMRMPMSCSSAGQVVGGSDFPEPGKIGHDRRQVLPLAD